MSVFYGMVTRRGQDAVVVLSAKDYQRLQAEPSLLHSLLNAPRGPALEIHRAKDKIRKVSL